MGEHEGGGVRGGKGARVPRDFDRLLAGLSGYKRSSSGSAIDALIAEPDDDLIERLERELAKSRWPLCVSLATALGRIGSDSAKAALVGSLAARSKHVRTAAINRLVITGDATLVGHIEPFLAGSAFASRIAAKDAIRALTGGELVGSLADGRGRGRWGGGEIGR